MKFSHWWAGLPGLIYDLGKHSGSKKTTSASSDDASSENSASTQKVNSIYNYMLDDETNGNTLFGSKKKTNRTLFGSEVV